MKHADRAAKTVCVLIAGIAGLAQACIAQASRFEGRSIASIEFSPSQPLAPQDLDRVLPFKKGQPLHQEDVANAIDGLFSTGRFEDIAVEAEASGDGVLIRFVVKPARFVGGFGVNGRTPDPPSRAQVEIAAGLTLGAPFEDQQVDGAAQSLSRLLQANGLYEARVTPEVQQQNGQQVFISFTINKGKRAKYAMPVINGDPRLSDAVILRATGWRIPIIHWWRQVTDSRTHKGVAGLLKKYASQDRLRASVEVTKLEYDSGTRKVHPDLNVDPGPEIKISSVNTKVSKKVLKRYVPVFEEGAVDNSLLNEGKRNLIDYFQSEGYYDVDVEYRLLEPQTDLERVEYAISRGTRYKLVNLAIAGNTYFDTETIRARMFLAPSALFLPHGRYSEAFVRKDQENITQLYQGNGFRDVKVTSTLESNYKGKQNQIGVTMHIEQGAQWLVRNFEIRGASPERVKALEPLVLSAAGEPFAEAAVAVDRGTLLTYYYSHGFPSATFKATWQQSGAHEVSLVYTISEGDQQFVRDVVVTGLKVTKPREVNSWITVKPGDPISLAALGDVQKEFYNFGIFSRVDTAVENPDGDTDYKYVLYNFEEADRYSLGLGFGAQVAKFGAPSPTSLGSPSGQTGFSPEFSLTASRLNFLGLGHTVTAQANYSSIEKRGSLSYLQPRFLHKEGRSLTYSLLYDDTFDVRTFAAKREQGSVQLSQKFTNVLTGLFTFTYRRVSTSSVVIPVLLVPQLAQPVRIGILSSSLIQDRRDNPADPHHGMYNTADFGVAGSFFGAQRNFGRLLLRNATYYTIGHNIVLARQTQIGLIRPFSPPAGVSAQESVPLPERFFSGGADSIRGFAYNEAGPRDTGAPLTMGGPSSEATGFPLGGNALFVNNIELRFPVIPNIQGVLFHDMGNVYDSIQDLSLRFHQKSSTNFNYAVQDVGFGVRYKTPVGPVRLDLAYALNPTSFVGFNGSPYQLLQCGPNAPRVGVCKPAPQNTGHFQFFFSIGQTF